MIYLSQNELKSVFYRMLVGAKFDVGTAEDIAKAGAFGAALGLPVYAALLEGLAVDDAAGHIDNQRFERAGPADFHWMLQALDLLQADMVSHCHAPAGPLDWLAVPLLAGMAPELSISASVQGDKFYLSEGQIYRLPPSEAEAGNTDLSISIAQDTGALPPPLATGPITIAEDIWAELDVLAAHSYVPATEASRLSGAGAGLSDND